MGSVPTGRAERSPDTVRRVAVVGGAVQQDAPQPRQPVGSASSRRQRWGTVIYRNDIGFTPDIAKWAM
jgi:hypothetical protein